MNKPSNHLRYEIIKQGTVTVDLAYLVTSFNEPYPEAVVVRLQISDKWCDTLGWEYNPETELASYTVLPPGGLEDHTVDTTIIQFPELKGYKLIADNVDGDGHLLVFVKIK